jgi:hypothetical protein
MVHESNIYKSIEKPISWNLYRIKRFSDMFTDPSEENEETQTHSPAEETSPLLEAEEFMLSLLKQGSCSKAEQVQLYRIFNKMGIGFVSLDGSTVRVVYKDKSINIHSPHGRSKENTLDPAAYKKLLSFALEVLKNTSPESMV